MNIPDTLPHLHQGAHEEGSRQLCAMEAASWLAAEPHSDQPMCVHPVLAEMARVVNDRVDDETRQGMWPLIIRCLGTASDDKVLSVRLAIFCATKVLSIYEDKYPGDYRPREAVEAAEEWAECPCEKHTNAAYTTNAAANDAAYAAYATYATHDATSVAYAHAHAAAAAHDAAYAAYAAATAATSTAAAAAANAAFAYTATNPVARVQLLIDLLDEYDRLTGRTTYQEPTEDAWERVLAGGRP